VTIDVIAQNPIFQWLHGRTARNTSRFRAFTIQIPFAFRDSKMDRHDQALLDKQMGRLIPPRHDGVIAVIVAGMFLAGLTSGIELTHKSAPEQNAVMALANADSALTVVRP
jgi:hypothetical protein